MHSQHLQSDLDCQCNTVRQTSPSCGRFSEPESLGKTSWHTKCDEGTDKRHKCMLLWVVNGLPESLARKPEEGQEMPQGPIQRLMGKTSWSKKWLQLLSSKYTHLTEPGPWSPNRQPKHVVYFYWRACPDRWSGGQNLQKSRSSSRNLAKVVTNGCLIQTLGQTTLTQQTENARFLKCSWIWVQDPPCMFSLQGKKKEITTLFIKELRIH